MFSIKYPEEIGEYIYTTNALERFMKELKRRSKVTEVFPGPDACAKVLHLVAQEVNETYQRRTLRDFWLVKEELLSVRGAKSGQAEPIPGQLCPVSHRQDS
jgi:transposase-like protein